MELYLSSVELHKWTDLLNHNLCMLSFWEEEVNDLGVNVALSMLKFYKSKFISAVRILYVFTAWFLGIKTVGICFATTMQLS